MKMRTSDLCLLGVYALVMGALAGVFLWGLFEIMAYGTKAAPPATTGPQ